MTTPAAEVKSIGTRPFLLRFAESAPGEVVGRTYVTKSTGETSDEAQGLAGRTVITRAPETTDEAGFTRRHTMAPKRAPFLVGAAHTVAGVVVGSTLITETKETTDD